MKTTYILWGSILPIEVISVDCNRNLHHLITYNRGRYRISRKGGRGLSRVWIFHTWTFCSGTYHAVHGQNVGGQNTGGPNASQNCKGGGGGGGGGQNAVHFMGQGGQNAYLNKTLYI